ncbi:alanine racemase [Emcibacter sp. SYSU 3D8]|uniref:alanine racemase n=1 Tax=Emcibacter sp. SYSU 3D8 TaxID=3133969 RepID=UPI0031FE796B
MQWQSARYLSVMAFSYPQNTESVPPAGVIEIDLVALADNYRLMQAQAHGAEVAAAVKADAYGLGAGRVGKALWDAGCRRFFVATIAEGLSLRRMLPQAKIAVLNGLMAGDEESVREARLTPVLNDLDQVARWNDACGRAGDRGAAMIHVDTGMNRLGMTMAEAATLAASAPENFRIAVVMSHLACARRPEHPLNARQLQRFRQVRSLFPDAQASLANSAGVLIGEAYCFDLARVGIALYGGNPVEGWPDPMKPVVRLSVRVLQERFVEAGETVGYEATYTTTRPARLAVIAAGYADGWPTPASGRGKACAGGVIVPFAGRVSMDLIALDVTDAPESAAAPGAMIDLIGPEWTLDDAASAAGLISYELLTGLGRRFERRYL